jgi:hypothetical protein
MNNMQLYLVEFKSDNYTIYVKEDEYDDFARAMALLSLEYTAIVVEDKMYSIHWFDYIDDEWNIIWCTKDEFDSVLIDVKNAEVEYYIEEYN